MGQSSASQPADMNLNGSSEPCDSILGVPLLHDTVHKLHCITKSIATMQLQKRWCDEILHPLSLGSVINKYLN